MANFVINFKDLEIEISNFETLLSSKAALEEKADIAPFFLTNKNLSAFVACINNDVRNYTYLKSEFTLHKKYRPDLVVGDKEKGNFCFIEFEDAKKDSVFTQEKSSGKSDYATRFGKGFGQLVDWIREIDINKNSKYIHIFNEDIELKSYKVVLVIGRSDFINTKQRERLDWFQEYTVINSKKISIMTYDDLLEIVKLRFNSGIMPSSEK